MNDGIEGRGGSKHLNSLNLRDSKGNAFLVVGLDFWKISMTIIYSVTLLIRFRYGDATLIFLNFLFKVLITFYIKAVNNPEEHICMKIIIEGSC